MSTSLSYYNCVKILLVFADKMVCKLLMMDFQNETSECLKLIRAFEGYVEQ